MACGEFQFRGFLHIHHHFGAEHIILLQIQTACEHHALIIGSADGLEARALVRTLVQFNAGSVKGGFQELLRLGS